MSSSLPTPTVVPESSVPVESAPPPPANVEQRARSDRRKSPTGPWQAFLPEGRRMRNRRVNEHCQSYFVDRFSIGMFLGVGMLILASLVDAILTVRILQAGGEEINPLMERLLSHSLEAFVLGKYALTVVGLPLLLIFKNHYLFGTRFRVGYLVPVAVVMYGVLIGYQIVLIHRYVVW